MRRAFSPASVSNLGAWHTPTSMYQDAAMTLPVIETDTLVAAWADVSGNEFHLTNATVGEQPVANSQNFPGYGASFDGANDALYYASIPALQMLMQVSGATIFVVAIPDDVAAAQTLVKFSEGVTDGSSRAELIIAATAAGSLAPQGKRVDGDTVSALESSADQVTNDPQIFCGWFDYANALAASYLNGIELYHPSTFKTPGQTTNTKSKPGTGLSVGANKFSGGIFEVIIYNRALTTTEISAITTYLGAKYGITVS